MKKIKLIVITFLVALMVTAFGINAFAAIDFDFYEGTFAEFPSKTDALSLEAGELGSVWVLANNDGEACPDNIGILSDDVVDGEEFDSFKYYGNQMWTDSCDNAALAANGETNASGENQYVEFKMKDGGTNKYCYYVQYKELDVKVDSFALIQSDELHADTDSDPYPWWRQDAAFDILVSQDGGETYSVAYQSVRLTRDESGNLLTAASLNKEKGGEWTFVTNKDESGNITSQYRYIEADFNQTYENVTNVVYACVTPRLDNDTNFTTYWYFMARINEFDVFEAEKTSTATDAPADATDAPADETNAPASTDAPAATDVPSATDVPAATDAPAEKKSGCGSTLAIGGIAFTMGLCVVAFRKKNER